MKIIAIGREYAAGGHSVGNRVAEMLGIPLYDKDIIRAAADEMGISTDEVKRLEEINTKGDKLLRAINPVSFDIKDTIYDYQVKFIKEKAAEGPCVFLGRCAGFVLKEAGIDCLSVFLKADVADKLERAKELLENDNDTEVLREIKKRDNGRNAYFSRCTGKNNNDLDNWDLMLDTGSLGYEKCAEIICKAAQ